MCRLFYTSSIFCLFLLLSVSCNNSNLLESGYAEKEIIQFANNSRLSLSRGSQNSFDVSYDDLESYISFRTMISNDSLCKIKSVKPFPTSENPTLYIINYSNYWEVVSSDKRTPAVIASGKGEFNVGNESNKSLVWLYCLSEEIGVLKTSDELPVHSEDNLRFWRLIVSDKSLFDAKTSTTRSGPDTLDHPVPGHYELYDVEANEVVSDSINHLIETKWGQDSPYNQYCPIDSSYVEYYRYYNGFDPDAADLYHCLTGCVALAGGQMLYYLSNNMGSGGIPIYRYASCNTREFPGTNYDAMQQWDQSHLNWSYFYGSDSLRMAAVMLANIGKHCQMRYYGGYRYYNYMGEEGYIGTSLLSTSRLERLQHALYSEYGTDSFLFNFDEISFNLYDYIESLLENGFPSIIDAGVNDTLTMRHAFIVDRYKKTYTEYVYSYHFVPDDPNLPYYMFEEVQYYYESPEVTYFGMNWGERDNNDDAWYVKSGSWYLGNNNYNRRCYVLTFDTQAAPQEVIQQVTITASR
ncbi:MAG: C10 family peptidase [Bacteroidales bacterium]|nr:C10 family peptidase [Bacteroidales bacterium]